MQLTKDDAIILHQCLKKGGETAEAESARLKAMRRLAQTGLLYRHSNGKFCTSPKGNIKLAQWKRENIKEADFDAAFTSAR